MKLPRGVSADRVIRALERLGYAVIRQKAATSGYGTMGRLSTRSRSLCTTRSRLATLHGILCEVAQTRSITIESITDLL